MSILSVNQISPVGSGTTITLTSTETKTGSIISVGTGASVFSPAGNTLALGTNNVERIRIKNDGKVGIGTNNPQAMLEVQDRSGGTLIGLSVGTQYGNASFGGYNNYPAIMNNVGDPLIYCDTNNDRTIFFGDTVGFGTTCAFRVNGAERLRITGDGKIGVGESNPTVSMHLKRDQTSNHYLRVENINSNSNYTAISLKTPQLDFQIWNQGPGGTGYGGANSVNFYQGAATGPYCFFHGTSERLRIDSSGRVLIGLTASQTTDSNAHSKLQIASSAGPNIGLGNNSTDINDDGRLGTINYNSNHGGTYHEVVTIRAAADADHASNSKPSRLEFYTTQTGNTQATERLRITSDGSTQIASGVLQRRYESTNTAGYRYYSKADRFQIAHGGSGTNLTITGMNQGWASIRFGGYTEGNRVNFRADIGGYNAGNAGVRLYDSNEITNQASNYAGGSTCNITVTKNNDSYVVNITQTNNQSATMASFYYFETGGYNSVSTLTIS